MLGVVAGDAEFWNTLERGERSELWGMLSILDMWGLLGAALDTLGEMGDGVVSSTIGSCGRWLLCDVNCGEVVVVLKKRDTNIFSIS